MTDGAGPPLVGIRELSLGFTTGQGVVHALRGVDLDIARGRIVGVVGESGSGKSTLALAILRLLPANLGYLAGRIELDGVDLLALGEPAMRALRGDRLAMVFQDPMTALNPVFSIGTQLSDIQRRRGRPRRERLARAGAMLRRVGIPDAAERLSRYPHQFSGGMRQRIMIAMALLAEPDLLIADEPTTALDATVEAQIVALMQELRRDFQGSILFISHSLGLVSELCDDVVVMYAGAVVETAPAPALFAAPRHPYTAALLACEPTADSRAGGRFASIPGEVPDLRRPIAGCAFAPRCPRAEAVCRVERPALRAVAPVQRAACHFA